MPKPRTPQLVKNTLLAFPNHCKEQPPYSLRPYPLPVPRVSHVRAEAGMVYKLIVMQNKTSVSDNLYIKENV